MSLCQGCRPDDQFVSNVENFVCPVCLLFPDPETCIEHAQCGNLFCLPCWEQLRVQITRCPSCNAENFSQEGEFRTVKQGNKSLYRQLLSLEVRCDNRFNGCTATIKLEALRQHLKECPYGVVKCQECNEDMLKSDINSHVDVCVQKLTKQALPLVQIVQDEVTKKSTLQVCEATLKRIQRISNPIRTIVVAGTYQMGKSTLLNTLVHIEKMKKGTSEEGSDISPVFQMGEGSEAVTKGLWAYAVDQEVGEGEKFTTLFIDTEGLDDPSQDSRITEFLSCLGLTIASHYIYRVRKNVGKNELGQLNSFAKLATARIKGSLKPRNEQISTTTSLYEASGSSSAPDITQVFTFLIQDNRGKDIETFQKKIFDFKVQLSQAFHVQIEPTPNPVCQEEDKVIMNPKRPPFRDYFDVVNKSLARTRPFHSFLDGDNFSRCISAVCDLLNREASLNNLNYDTVAKFTFLLNAVDNVVALYKKYLHKKLQKVDAQSEFEVIEHRARAHALNELEKQYQDFTGENIIKKEDTDYHNFRNEAQRRMNDIKPLVYIEFTKKQASVSNSALYSLAGGVVGSVAGAFIGGFAGGRAGALVGATAAVTVFETIKRWNANK